MIPQKKFSPYSLVPYSPGGVGAHPNSRINMGMDSFASRSILDFVKRRPTQPAPAYTPSARVSLPRLPIAKRV